MQFLLRVNLPGTASLPPRRGPSWLIGHLELLDSRVPLGHLLRLLSIEYYWDDSFPARFRPWVIEKMDVFELPVMRSTAQQLASLDLIQEALVLSRPKWRRPISQFTY